MINILQQSVEKFIRTDFFNKRDETMPIFWTRQSASRDIIAFPILQQCNWWNTQVSHLTVPVPSLRKGQACMRHSTVATGRLRLGLFSSLSKMRKTILIRSGFRNLVAM